MATGMSPFPAFDTLHYEGRMLRRTLSRGLPGYRACEGPDRVDRCCPTVSDRRHPPPPFRPACPGEFQFYDIDTHVPRPNQP